MNSRPFHDFERAGWEGVALEYEQAFARLTTQSVGPLLDITGVGKGTAVLDVGSGPGYAAAAATERGARAIGVDFSAAMVALAKRRYPNVDFHQGDAEALPFPDRSFDAVVMNFALLHLEQPEQALREAHRVLKPGGRLGFTVWAAPTETLGFQIVLSAVATHGRPDMHLPPGPPFFRFSEPEECRHALLAARFSGPQVVRVPQTWHLSSPDALFAIMQEATVRTRALLRAQSAQESDAIRRAVREAVLGREREGRVELPMPSVLASAVKP